MANETTRKLDPTAAVKAQINDYLDFAVKYQGLKITEENYLNLASKLCAVATKYALEDQHEYTPKSIIDTIGDLHTSAAVCQYLNITQEELDNLVEDHLILKLTDTKGRNGYPAVQFKNGTIRPDLQKIIKTALDFPNPLDPTQPFRTPWEVAFRLTGESYLYGGRNLAEHLDKHPEKLNEEIDMLLADLNTSACYC